MHTYYIHVCVCGRGVCVCSEFTLKCQLNRECERYSFMAQGTQINEYDFIFKQQV